MPWFWQVLSMASSAIQISPSCLDIAAAHAKIFLRFFHHKPQNHSGTPTNGKRVQYQICNVPGDFSLNEH